MALTRGFSAHLVIHTIGSRRWCGPTSVVLAIQAGVTGELCDERIVR